MNALLLRNLGGMRRANSLQSFSEYRLSEAQNPQLSSVTSEGTLLEYETLELRIHPPNVQIDNDSYDDMTVITIDSANRPGTLIEVVQCLTELGLSIKRARISSDGGWFVDEFFVTDNPKGKVLDTRKLGAITKVLSVESDLSNRSREACTVFELAGRDRHGLLAAVLQLLVVNGCEVLSAAVWTYHDRVALVISTSERGAPLVDPLKLDRLEQILYEMLGAGDAVVNSELVRGEIHHERRLHHLLLLEELKSWEVQAGAAAASADALPVGSGASTGAHSPAGPNGNSTSPIAPSSPHGVMTSVVPPDVFRSYSDGREMLDQYIDVGLPCMEASGMLSPIHEELPPTRSSGGSFGGEAGLPSSASVVAAVEQAAAAAAEGSGGSSATLSRPSSFSSRTGSQTGTVAITSIPSFGRRSDPMGMNLAPAPTASLTSYSNQVDQLAPLRRSDVHIQHSTLLNYWLVTITCRDRNKLFFDTVCTLADMNYDIYHATIDSEGDSASQLFYVRPRYGECVWDERRAAKLKYMLSSAVQRRFPRGLKVCVQSGERSCLAHLFSTLSNGGFWITRAEARTFHDSATFEFTLTDTRGQIPEHNGVQRICESVGGIMVQDVYGHSGNTPSRMAMTNSARSPFVALPGGFRFSILERKWNRGWGGGANGLSLSAGSYDSILGSSGSM